MKTQVSSGYTAPFFEQALAEIPASERAFFDMSFNISERLHEVLRERGMSKKDLARATGKKESEVSRWFSLGHNFTCKTIALISSALGVDIVTVQRGTCPEG